MPDDGAVSPSVALVRVPWDDDDATRLRAAQQAELAERYDGTEDIEPELPADEMLATVLLLLGGEVAGCGALRDAARLGPGVGELKRMYVLPAFRGRGLSRHVLTGLERIAVEHGLSRLVLETGVRQPEAIGLYLSAGYLPIESFPPYELEPASRCFARDLGEPGSRKAPAVRSTS